MPLLESFPMLIASSIVSGSLFPTVSGSLSALNPAITATIPITTIGAAPQYTAKRPTKFAQIPPTEKKIKIWVHTEKTIKEM